MPPATRALEWEVAVLMTKSLVASGGNRKGEGVEGLLSSAGRAVGCQPLR